MTRDIPRFKGAVTSSEDPGWDGSRQAFNLTVDQRPALIARPKDADDVAAVVAFARANGLRVAPQRTGHNAGPLGDLSRTVLLKTELLRGVDIDRDAGRARVEAGAVWADLVPQASDMGLAAPHGSSPLVGIVGYSLGGGIGWYARKLGLACNRVTRVEVVTAAGDRVVVDPNSEPDLFWALRGGGGSFAVVTALEFDLTPLDDLYAGAMFFPLDRADEVLGTWHELLPSLPEEMTSVGRVLRFPPIPDIPEPLRGREFALVEAVHMGTPEEGAELLKPIRDLGPEMDTFGPVSPADLADLHMDPPEPAPAMSTSALLTSLPSGKLDEILGLVGPGRDSDLLSFELRHTDGALSRKVDGCGALGSVSGSLMAFAVGISMDANTGARLGAELTQLDEVLSDVTCGMFGSFVETRHDVREFFEPSSFERLQATRHRYDPDALIHANHSIDPV